MASRGHSSSRCVGLSLSWPFLLRTTGSRCVGSVVVAHRPSCSATCGIFPDRGSNLCPLHWQADSQPPRHQGSPFLLFLLAFFVSGWLTVLSMLFFDLFLKKQKFTIPILTLSSTSSELCSYVLVLFAYLFISSRDKRKKAFWKLSDV